MQSKWISLIEATTSNAIGFIVAFIFQLLIFPSFGIHISISDNLQINFYFFAISIIRSYLVRRWFDKRKNN